MFALDVSEVKLPSKRKPLQLRAVFSFEMKESPQECYERVTTYRKAHPQVSWREVFENVPSHYSSPVSLYGAMFQVEKKRAREDFEFAQKYPLGPMTRGLPRWSIFYKSLWQALYK